jgi:hypothetical protein
MKTLLNAKEKETAYNITGILLRGSPEWLIANHLFKINPNVPVGDISSYLDKLSILPEETKFLICNHFRDISRKQCFDRPRSNGVNLLRWLNLLPKKA